MHCVICRGQKIRRLFFKQHYWICACRECDHHFVEIRPSPNHVELVYADAYFSGGGAGYPDYLCEREILIRQGKRYADLLSKYTEPGSILDIGAAAGFLLKGFIEAGWTGLGIEPNSSMAAHGQRELGLKIINTPLEAFSSKDKYRLITMVQVIAHFYNLRQALHNATTMLEPGGLVLVETWNKDSWIARLAKSNWHEYNPPSVLHFFSRRNLIILMSQFGLEPLAMGRPRKWISARHLKSVLAYNATSSSVPSLLAASISRLLPDRSMVPYPALDLFWALFRKPHHA
ncbi:class I SAM-dependent methyltransferase [bacterium]|nr:class I SAM-dependent methyltransferase [bacterium]